MDNGSHKNISSIKQDSYMVWFFAGGETRDDKFNVFTGSFIRLMKLILGNDFDFIRSIYYRMPMMNVIWALNNCQRPVIDPHKNHFVEIAARQIISETYSPHTQIIIVASSSGSIIAAQTVCHMIEKNRENRRFHKPLHLALGSSLISKDSCLFKKLISYQEEGFIGKLIHDDLHDKDDNINGSGGITRIEAYSNAFGLMFPVLSTRYNGPSFLNTHPVNGHPHRVRSQTVQKAIDYIDVLLV